MKSNLTCKICQLVFYSSILVPSISSMHIYVSAPNIKTNLQEKVALLSG